ncbi:MAG: hypothetical protein CM15mP119_1700 [Alphaproteobacteria bacterium]|nr:MAG: hypothetical protein CM15mP119_1700 [Alphaproteobacteria bacterium]
MTVSIAVTSGKGGVGKTNCAVNLSLSLTKMGKKVVLFDTDFGMANAHILLGTNPKRTAADFLRGTAGLRVFYLMDHLTYGSLPEAAVF